MGIDVGQEKMEDLTLIGLILLIVGVILAIPTCFLSLIVLGIIGVILIVIGESQPKKVPPYGGYYPPGPYPQQPYQQAPYQYPGYSTPTNSCPACGSPMRYVQQYNNWYCDYCRSYR
jgi:hypothetical protein